MSKIKNAVMIYVVALMSGILSSLMVAQYFATEIWNNADRALFKDNISESLHIEQVVSNAIHSTQLLEDGDLDAIKRSNCFALSLFAAELNPELYGDAPSRKAEIMALKNEGLSTLEKLSNEGYCD